jgi:hypothetical protein
MKITLVGKQESNFLGERFTKARASKDNRPESTDLKV